MGWRVALAVEALYHAGERGILLGVWKSLGQNHIPDHLKEFCKENVLFFSFAPHEWLFPQCACIVYHGGSGKNCSITDPIRSDLICSLFLFLNIIFVFFLFFGLS
jgi:hypothetical protein